MQGNFSADGPGMTSFLNTLAQRYLERKGFHVLHSTQFRPDLPPSFWNLWSKISPYTLTSPERGYALYQGIHHLEQRGIEGDFVECGVYKGGSTMLAALTLLETKNTNRTLWLYDTYEGMPAPTAEDRIASSGQPVQERWTQGWWKSPLEEVRQRVEATGYPKEKLEFVVGDVAHTLPTQKPEKIALLRLDTDWYESTKIELEVLYPLLAPGGILIIDDYGHFTGARKAVDEYFATPPLFHRLDYTGRMIQKM